jgi:hypothetical protein
MAIAIFFDCPNTTRLNLTDYFLREGGEAALSQKSYSSCFCKDTNPIELYEIERFTEEYSENLRKKHLAALEISGFSV